MPHLILENISGSLPTSTYSFFDQVKKVGFIQIRHRPSRSPGLPAVFASHIYYEIDPRHRNKGYGKEILRLGLIEAKKLGLKEIWLTTFEDNCASKKIIEVNEGKLTNARLINKKSFLKYTITL